MVPPAWTTTRYGDRSGARGRVPSGCGAQNFAWRPLCLEGLCLLPTVQCAALISPCKGNSTCENTPGSYKCNCSKGYWYTGTGCADANECLQSWPGPCQGSGFCANTLGGYRCDCPNQPTKFYNATRGDCQDPCVPNPCGLGTCARALTSTGRKYTCSCPSTSVWNATTGTCNAVLSLSGTNVAQGKPVTCSSNPNQCTSAVDGSTSTGWMSYDMGGRICVNVTLGTSPISITKVNVSCAASSNGTASIAIQQSTGTTVWDYTTSGSPSLPIIVEGTQVWAYSFSQAYSAKSLKWCYSPYDWSASQFATMMVIYELRVIAA
ncbi:hypothetical protein HYH03_011012 [Edaphochlamys debaryana]|uniref:EGF-like domain-containing protein n=1 Tax=Edaphochlamys debaryana TaxID=47281 RepID=A0A835XVK7_9CHLO|nr:hypothetical protein HYH03_011012 [Edaphochlamys debaryana]|eukprot:KAG2490620.1 hypothetical protein HYH03_011012 [Edaphochlamys debaryana]